MGTKKMIFIIDDDPGIVELAREVLEENNFEIRTASSEEGGLELLHETTPDLVLCDMMMEEIDSGVRIVQELRKRNSEIPVFLMSNIGNATARYMDLNTMGFSGVIQKPISSEKLIETVRGALGL